MSRFPFRIWVFLFFFISGATGLIYEVVWTRLLTLVLGNTHYSVSTVLTTFMGGLALGSFFGGRWIDRGGRPLLIYALLEGAIGIYCFLIPHFIDASLPFFQWIYSNFQQSYTLTSFFRFMVCGAILLVPASLMGATLPILGKFVSEKPEVIGRDVGTLYAVNTFGAVAGALTSAFVFMKLYGVDVTIGITAGLNLGLASVILIFFRSQWEGFMPASDLPSSDKASRFYTPEVMLILGGFCVTGIASLIYQVAWTRIFSLLLGSSVYAFSLILTAFILGLAFGTLVFSRIVGRFGDLKKVFGWLQVGIGLSALAALPFFGKVPLINRWVYLNRGLDFSVIQWSNFLIILSLIFVPTFLMGAQFPVVVRLVARDLKTLGHHVGTAYASNTVGTILGSLIGGFLLIPLLGVQNTILWAVFINIVLGIVLLYSSTITVNVKTYILPGLLVLWILGARSIAPWDKAVISSGSFMPYRIEELEGALQKKNKILFYKEGMHTTVTTELSIDGNIFLRVNGKTDASLAMDMRTQLLSGYLPMFFHQKPQDVLVVGQGSGVTLGAVTQFPAKSIDLVEISPTVIEGSRFFDPFNHHALDDPRVRVILEDGRNHITLTKKNYDVIISEPSNPWISGIGALFTKDFYELANARLKPGGIMCIWMHTNMSPESFKSISRAFLSVFPNVTMWESIVGDDYLLIGSQQPYSMPYEGVRRLIENPVRGRELKRLGISSVRDVMGLMVMDQDELKKFSEGAPVHTDDNSLLEFGAPEYIYKDERQVIVRQITPHFQVLPSLLRFEELDGEQSELIKRQVGTLERSEVQVNEIRRKARIDQYLDEAMAAVDRGALEKAVELYMKILEQEPEHILTHMNLGNVYFVVQEFEKAEAAYRKTLEINPYYVFGAVSLAKLYLKTNRRDLAVGVLQKVQEWLPRDQEVNRLLEMIYKNPKTR
ncbi:MAG: fused MFS/spermidine synthase [Nitrospinota bacterium]|nr:fused MFS/spermidine synthase [Nitrospinota bacterium]